MSVVQQNGKTYVNGVEYENCNDVEVRGKDVYCNGVKMNPKNGKSGQAASACPGEKVFLCTNGNGLVSENVKFDRNVYIEKGSVVCGASEIWGNVRITGNTHFNKGVRIVSSRKNLPTIIHNSNFSSHARIENSTVSDVTANGEIEIFGSVVKNAIINSSSTIGWSTISDLTINAHFESQFCKLSDIVINSSRKLEKMELNDAVL